MSTQVVTPPADDVIPDGVAEEIPFDFDIEAPVAAAPEPVPVEPESEPQGSGIAGDPDNGVVAAPPTPEVPVAPKEPAHLPVALDHLMIADIIAVSDSEQFLQMFADFERQIENKITPLKSLLDKVIMSTEVTQVEQHAAHVDAWRNRITRFASLASAFVEHAKSSRLMMPKGKGITDFDREAHKRTMAAGYVGLSRRLEGLIDDIDSRVNLCKKNTDREKAGFRNMSGVVH